MVTTSDSLGPLPSNWEAAYSENGEKYFIDHNTGTTHWDDPRSAASKESPLPDGWERVDDEQHGTFYVDHVNKRTQYERPQRQSMPPTTNGYASNGHMKPEHYFRSNGEANGGNHIHPSSKSVVMNQNENGVYGGGGAKHFNGALAIGKGSHYEFRSPQPQTTGIISRNGEAVWQQQTEVSPSSSSSSSAAHQQHYKSLPANGHSHSAAQKPPTGCTLNGRGVLYNGFHIHHTKMPSTSPNGNIYQRPQQHPPQQFSSNSPFFTRDPAQLRGELLTARIQKGNKGLGFTLIGNDGSNPRPEFIQIKSVIPNGPAAMNNLLHTGDVLVYVNNECMLGASQDDACRIFRSIPVGEVATIQVCRGYPLVLDPANKIVTENVYCCPVTTNFHARSKEDIGIEICKGPKGFGFTITDSLQGQRVKTVLYPDQCPNLLEGDIILEVGGRNVRALSHAQLVQMLQECNIGYKTTMLVSRYSQRHRSRTPTAGFRYGEKGVNQQTSSFGPRSKTPAPASSTYQRSNGGGRPGQFNSATWNNNTMPREQGENGFRHHTVPQPIRPSSTSLGFSSTPNYMPISAFGAPVARLTGQQHITVNLIRKPDGFGFRLVGGEEMGIPLTVGAIIPGGAASQDGRLREQDQIIEIDGKPVEHGRHDVAVEMIKNAAAVGHVKLVVRRLRDDPSPAATMSYGVGNNLDYEDTASLSPYDVHLAKLDNEEFGCTIISQSHRYIGTIIPDSPAERCGRLRAGDCVLAINALPVYNMTHQQVVNYIKSSGNTITFTIDPANRMPIGNGDSAVSTLKAHQSNASNYGTLMNGASRVHRTDDIVIEVELSRGNKGFGFSIRGGWEFGNMPLYILRIAEDGPAAVDGRLNVGDQLVEINNESTTGMSHERAIQIIKQNPVVRLLVKRPKL